METTVILAQHQPFQDTELLLATMHATELVQELDLLALGCLLALGTELLGTERVTFLAL